MTKDDLRRVMKSELKALSTDDLKLKSQSIESALINYLDSLHHNTPLSVIGMYLPMRGEPQWNWSQWRQYSWRLSFPSPEGNFLTPFELPDSGIWVTEGESVAPDILVIPGLAFSTQGFRLGRGTGWYDKLLARFQPRLGCVGVCFDQQFGHEFLTDTHDQKMQMILTDLRMVMTS